MRTVVLSAGVALALLTPGARIGAQVAPAKSYEFGVRDIAYQRSGDKVRLARLYQPAGTGPFPAIVQVHGGAWNTKDRTDGQHVALELAGRGIVVLSLDFRNAPEAPYPASLQDINYGVRWLKAHAREFGSSPERVGIYGTSSGGHQVLLTAIRPDDKRYTALPLTEAPQVDAKVAFVVSGWGVLFPEERYKIAKTQNRPDLIKSHITFFGDEQTMVEASPPLIIERGEKVVLPPALVFQGTADEWTSVDLAKRFAAIYRGAGGTVDLQFLEGERHTFVNEHPFTPNSLKAIAMVKAFIKKYGGPASTSH
jgi:acetyl esterase/lipase